MCQRVTPDPSEEGRAALAYLTARSWPCGNPPGLTFAIHGGLTMTELVSSSDHAPPRDSATGAQAGDPVFELHRGGKIAVSLSVPLESRDDLSMAYTPGVARVCTAIADQPELAGTYTWMANTVAVVSDGTAVLGLGDIGPAAAMPVMEGKAALFKRFAGVANRAFGPVSGRCCRRAAQRVTARRS
jgi:Malic enzyme, N-terminal domain